MKLIPLLLIALTLTGCAVADAKPSVPVKPVEVVELQITEADIEILKESCVMIYADNGETEVQGSAVAIGENRYLTAYHAIADGRTNLKTSDGEKLTIESYSEELDIMVLTSENEAVPVKIGDSDNVRVNDEVIIIGSPMGEKNTVIRTTVKLLVDGIVTWKTVGGGTSGGAVFDTQGNLIGIVISGSAMDYVTIAVPINTILEQL